MNKKSSYNGFTLIEVLVAIVVFSFGLLGVAGMMTISVKNNHNGYLRSQANFLAENMVDRMRANPVALFNGDYDGTASTGASDCVTASPCTFAELAQYDTEQWAQSISSMLPSGEGTIACANPNAPDLSSIDEAKGISIWIPYPPYSGMCTITVNWRESNEASAQDAQTLVLVAQP